jgi:POT family proton-dependent oligopeptide transporter
MTAVSAREAAIHEDRSFIGHPKGLAFLSFTEAWERFSYYGMQTLLVLYMTKQLLLPGHVERIAGFSQFRAVLEHGHPMTIVALASAIFGLYTAMVYATPALGGLLADRVLGRTRTIVLGALLMALGHFLMAFDASFLVALVCLMLGSGCFKGNIATQVGSLYPPDDLRRADAFQVFYLGINAGVIAAPFVTGTLAEKVAWHWGFGAAGVGMLISLVIYLAGRRHLPPDPPLRRAVAKSARPPMTAHEWRVVVLLLALLPVLAASIVGNNQIFNAYLLWADKSVDRHLFGVPILTEYLVSVDSFVSVATLAGMVVFWRAWKTRFPEPDELGKIIIGCLFSGAGVACLAAGAEVAAASGQKVSMGWLLAFHLLNDIGFANVLPVGLALYARAAPKALAGTIVGIYYLHLFAGNLAVGWLGGLLDKMPAAEFWLLHAALVIGAGVAFFFVRLAFGRLLAGEPAEPDLPEVVAADAQELP